MTLAILNHKIAQLSDAIWWPWIIIFMVIAGGLVTVALNFVQFRYFLQSWKLVLFPDKASKVKAGDADMTPIQAFINTLGANTGNGNIAGIATAVHFGGPGAAFWLFMIGFLSMALRFAEVYLAVAFIGKGPKGSSLGGPMAYLKKLPGGNMLAYLFAFFCFLYVLMSGNIIQCNSVGLGLQRILGLNPYVIATVLTSFVLYVVLGGAQRVIAISDRLVPFKVGLFLISSTLVLIYHATSIIPAIRLMIYGAFNPIALTGGVLGISVRHAVRFGLSRGLNANEAGLGTAGVFSGATGSKEPVKDGIMSMLGTFITTHMICFMVALTIVASGVWDNGLNSTALTISAFETVFGALGGWVVTICSASFGVGVIVAFSYVGQACWNYLTGGRYARAFPYIYAATAFVGTIAKVQLIWNLSDMINAGMILINVSGILYLLPTITKGLADFAKKRKA